MLGWPTNGFLGDVNESEVRFQFQAKGGVHWCMLPFSPCSIEGVSAEIRGRPTSGGELFSSANTIRAATSPIPAGTIIPICHPYLVGREEELGGYYAGEGERGYSTLEQNMNKLQHRDPPQSSGLLPPCPTMFLLSMNEIYIQQLPNIFENAYTLWKP